LVTRFARSPLGEFREWVDLKEAEQLTGIPASTIRNWSRKDRIDSRFEIDESEHRRYVLLSDVIRHADHLGRALKPLSEQPLETSDSVDSIDAQYEPEGTPTPETEERISESEEASADDIEPALHQDEIIPPEGSMIVPLDAWNKMIEQLGNLHEAGQQLAEARERAGKAETEAIFLRERLVDMREQLADMRTLTSDLKPAPLPPIVDEEPEPLIVDLYRRWKRRR
jgi:DNA-binding transcriptional MerR regulator